MLENEMSREVVFMDEFSLEKKSEQIYNGNTKKYFKEVLSSYYNGNYRSAVVMLWSVVICDLVYKLESLIDIYNDPTARVILNEVTTSQQRNPKSPEWEMELVTKVHQGTELLEVSDHTNLQFLQQQRHLAAHPILSSKDKELHIPNQDTVRSLIRNTLEGILLKPPLYGRKIFDRFVSDLEMDKLLLTTDEKLKNYLNSRYFSHFSIEIELDIFRSLWKLIFLLENEVCSRNREINYRVIKIITVRNKDKIIEKISNNSDQDYYSNIASNGEPLSYLISYLCKFDYLYTYFADHAKLKIQQHIHINPGSKLLGWFIKNNFETHIADIVNWIKKENHTISEKNWQNLEKLFKFHDIPEWESQFTKILAIYYGKSINYPMADERFTVAIEPYLELFTKDSLSILIQEIKENDQIRGRRRSTHDHSKVRKRVYEVFGNDSSEALLIDL